MMKDEEKTKAGSGILYDLQPATFNLPHIFITGKMDAQISKKDEK